MSTKAKHILQVVNVQVEKNYAQQNSIPVEILQLERTSINENSSHENEVKREISKNLVSPKFAVVVS